MRKMCLSHLTSTLKAWIVWLTALVLDLQEFHLYLEPSGHGCLMFLGFCVKKTLTPLNIRLCVGVKNPR